ncbi:glutamyl-tRNA reductase [Leucobacter exalbidus]|uniref:Glutamyl-tRNA reductase n=1 Tax=Leucobacter exalbidus TaxID=662960 RepID=A0A940PPN0_9MICO|nr:glutamyl-tRNA reductase [Leucobacter exalbidus]MBP1327023.1 glutamyl-tRNA reductase [Leucobacter exalbidus]
MNSSLVHTKFSDTASATSGGLSCLSIDHKSASLSLLERVERHADELVQTLTQNEGHTPLAGDSKTPDQGVISGADDAQQNGSVVIATCNRFEAYFDANSSAPEEAIRAIARITGVPETELTQATRVRHGVDAAHHLFEVSSGLESVVMGEGEIGGQVRRAFSQAKLAGSTTPELERLFQHAATVSKTVKARTRVQTQGRSLVRLALLLAESRIGDWAGTRVLLVGTGAYAAVTLAALRERGARHIAVHSPSGRAHTFAKTREVRPLERDALTAELAAADVIIACSTAQDPIVDAELVARTVTAAPRPFCTSFTGRAGTADLPRQRLFIDLGVPRNIAPEAAQVPGVEVLDLEVIAMHAGVEELSSETEARQITSAAAAEFAADQAERAAVPSVLALRDHVHSVLEAEIARAAKLGPEAAQVQAALRHFAGRLLHEPTLRLRALGRTGQAPVAAAAVQTLFGSSALEPVG